MTGVSRKVAAPIPIEGLFMRMVKFAAVAAALALLLAACGNGGNGEADPDASPQDEDVSQSEDGPGAELADDVAAVVNGEEIAAADVDAQVEAFASNPEIAAALDGDSGEQAQGMLRAQVLSTAIVNVIALATAEELGVPVTDDDVAAARAQLEDEAGGADALAQTLDDEGISSEQVDTQLQALAALRNIERAVAEDAEGGEDAQENPDAPSAGEVAAQQLLAEELASAEVVVNDDYGSWDPQVGQVVPPGGVPQAPAP